MSQPSPHSPVGLVAAFIARHETLRRVMTWLVDRLAGPLAGRLAASDVDDAIDWEDGEERDEANGPVPL